MKRTWTIACIISLTTFGRASAERPSPEEDAQIAALLALVQRGAERGAKENVDREERRSLNTFTRDEQKRLKARAEQEGGRYVGEATKAKERAWIPWSAAYEAIRPTNPLVTKACQDEAIEYAAALHTQKTGESPEKHFVDVTRAFQKNQLSAPDYFDHLTECQTFCAQIVARLLNCHVDAIAGLPADDTVLVLFGVGESEIDASAERRLRRFAERMRESRKQVLLFGSASRLSARDPRDVNETLSRHRAEAVRRRLLGAGVDDDRIYITWIGQDPPRLSDRAIAVRLGFEKPYARLRARSQPLYMDQNVLAVAWQKESDAR